jgi:hypothetical protein
MDIPPLLHIRYVLSLVLLCAMEMPGNNNNSRQPNEMRKCLEN